MGTRQDINSLISKINAGMLAPHSTCLPKPPNTNHIALFKMNESKGLELVANRQNLAHWHALFGPHSVFKVWNTCQTLRIRKFYTKSKFLKGPPPLDSQLLSAHSPVHPSPWYSILFLLYFTGLCSVHLYDLLDTVRISLMTPALMKG